MLGIDPSGSYKEGKGTTGWCLLDRDLNSIIKCGELRAESYSSQEAYWIAHLILIEQMFVKYREAGFVVSMEDYILYTNSIKSQINSAMETCQLIGAIKMACYVRSITLYMRTAVHVKRRWADSILVHNGYIYKSQQHYYTACHSPVLSDHVRDSIRHAVHCAIFELKEEEHANDRRKN